MQKVRQGEVERAEAAMAAEVNALHRPAARIDSALGECCRCTFRSRHLCRKQCSRVYARARCSSGHLDRTLTGNLHRLRSSYHPLAVV